MPESRSAPAILLILCLATLTAYLPAMPGTWLWDDELYLAENEAVKSPQGLYHIWFTPAVSPNYYPMVFTSFWLEYRLWGSHPHGYHLTNVLLHCLNSILLYWILRKLGIRGGLFAAGLFALHPVHAESVAWIAERKDVLSSGFFLSAVLVWISTGEENSTGQNTFLARWRGAVVLVLFAMAMLSKTVTCTLPLVLLLLAWYRHSVDWRKEIKRLLPLFIVALALGLLTVWWESARLGAGEAAAHLTFPERCLAAGRIPWFYLSKILLPVGLMPIYPLWDLDAADLKQWLFPLLTGAVSLGLFMARNTWGKPLFGTWFYFLITLAPALGFIDFSTMNLSLVADHYQYLASIGPLVLVAALLSHPQLPKALTRGIMIVTLTSLTLLTWSHAKDYLGPETFWRHALEGNPGCWAVHNNLGVALANKGEYDRAVECYEEAARLRPCFGEPLVNIGNAFLARGKSQEAIAAYLRAMQADPECATAPYRLGRFYDEIGEPLKAEENLSQALKIKPRFPEALNSLGVLKAQRGDFLGAIQLFEQALEIRPLHVKAARNLEQAQADLELASPGIRPGTKEESRGTVNP
jgi:protein O-mannosyl-transferase